MELLRDELGIDALGVRCLLSSTVQCSDFEAVLVLFIAVFTVRLACVNVPPRPYIIKEKTN